MQAGYLRSILVREELLPLHRRLRHYRLSQVSGGTNQTSKILRFAESGIPHRA
ncbi:MULTISPECIES: hypothetical protein [unclassified Microcoleus]|uniref:hypothetical protein n=1 Tax=unclassified Microcoleus TaxID=2642155 RepID=UPI0025E601C6|nr:MULTISPECIES: hypothetical protein [unclassified Microcoleus]